MRTIADRSHRERRTLSDLGQEIARRLPELRVHMVVFGSRARGDAEADSDMDILLEVETDRLAFPDRQRLRQIASEISLTSGIIPSLFVVDRQTRQERGDFSLFDNIRDEGIAVVSEREIRELASKAERSPVAARRLLEVGDYDCAVSRAYDATFYVARALLLTRDVRRSKHSGVRAAFASELVRSGELPAELFALLRDSFEDRGESDYGLAAIAEDQARAGLPGAHRFVRAVVERLVPILGRGEERSKERS